MVSFMYYCNQIFYENTGRPKSVKMYLRLHINPEGPPCLGNMSPPEHSYHIKGLTVHYFFKATAPKRRLRDSGALVRARSCYTSVRLGKLSFEK